MKPFKALRGLLQNLTFGRLKKTENDANTTSKHLISKSFSKDEDTFMFI
ncbi:hypothetical protein ITJ86_05065 [Winogradskyella sp. F6397]|uniref:DUF4372 domain-containing protein n=1 Tax=Winogradskyella marina TaxID=2785530 RepID=A0ABS0EFM4_9FLAO|nr:MULTISPECIES: hypothetical protein [Winogradskyella]MBF8149254.1 hypothetical protein [Winogradskyella marina]